MYENRVLRRRFGPNRQELGKDWKKKLHNEELHNLYASPSIVKEDEMGAVCSTHGRD
jgi:hypothetical protein